MLNCKIVKGILKLSLKRCNKRFLNSNMNLTWSKMKSLSSEAQIKVLIPPSSHRKSQLLNTLWNTKVYKESLRIEIRVSPTWNPISKVYKSRRTNRMRISRILRRWLTRWRRRLNIVRIKWRKEMNIFSHLKKRKVSIKSRWLLWRRRLLIPSETKRRSFKSKSPKYKPK